MIVLYQQQLKLMNQNHSQLFPLEEALLGLLVKNVGEGKFTEGEFQEIQTQEEPEQHFGFEEEEALDNSDKQLFRKSIALGPQKKPTINHHPPSLNLNKYLFVYGSNPGPHSVTLIQGKICRGIGTNIFFEGKIYSGHNYEITYLNYESSLNILISGTQGKCPEIRLWKVIKVEESAKLQPSDPCKLNLPMSCTGIGFAWLLEDDCLAVITRYTLHSNCQLFTFDLKTGKRKLCDGKLGKVVNMLCSSPALILNQEGICQLLVKQRSEAITTMIYRDSGTSALELTRGKDLLIIGSLNGSVRALELTKKNTIKSVTSHSKGVICIRSLGNNLFLSSGSDKRLILHKIDSQLNKIIKLSQIQLSSICLSVMPKSTSVICLLKNTDIIQLSFSEESIKLATNPLTTAMIYSPQPGPTVVPQLVYNKYNKKYMYSLSGTSQLCAFGFDERCQLISAKKAEISHSPSQLDIHGTTVAYVYQQDVDLSYKSTLKNQISSVLKKNQERNEILTIEDYTSKKIVGSMKLQSDRHCTKLKFNPSGDKLALGFQTGLISVYSLDKSQGINLIASSSIHSSLITDLFWSTDGKMLKSISTHNMVYLNLLPEKNTMTPVYTAKGIRQHLWLTCGKFDWKTFFLWDGHRNLPEDVTDVKQTSDYLLACMANGTLKVYRNPAGREGQELIRFFNRPFLLQIIREDDLRFWAIVAANGAVFGLEIGEDFSEEDENSSFQELQQQ